MDSLGSHPIDVLNLGLIDYLEALSVQESTLEKVSQGGHETLILCTHPNCLTVGRAAGSEGDLLGYKELPIHSVSRGGRVTYHGPHQLIGYPILRLKMRQLGLHEYLKLLEDKIIEWINLEYGLKCDPGSLKNLKGDLSHTGVWYEGRKIASIGIAVRKWVSYHGFAININKADVKPAFSPCGFNADVMSSLEEVTGSKRDISTLPLHNLINF